MNVASVVDPAAKAGVSAPAMSTSRSIVEIRDLRKVYRMGEIEVPVLQDVSLEIQRGAFQVIVGPSGCGRPRSSTCSGRSMRRRRGRSSSTDRTSRRSTTTSAPPTGSRRWVHLPVLQPDAALTALENVELGVEVVGGLRPDEIRKRCTEMLDRWGWAISSTSSPRSSRADSSSAWRSRGRWRRSHSRPLR